MSLHPQKTVVPDEIFDFTLVFSSLRCSLVFRRCLNTLMVFSYMMDGTKGSWCFSHPQPCRVYLDSCCTSKIREKLQDRHRNLHIELIHQPSSWMSYHFILYSRPSVDFCPLSHRHGLQDPLSRSRFSENPNLVNPKMRKTGLPVLHYSQMGTMETNPN